MTKILNGCGLGVKLGLKYLENGKNYLFSEDFSGIHSVQPQQGMELQEQKKKIKSRQKSCSDTALG